MNLKITGAFFFFYLLFKLVIPGAAALSSLENLLDMLISESESLGIAPKV